MRAPDSLERSQRKLFLAIQQELRYLEKAKGPQVRAYERAFRRSLPRDVKASSKRALVARSLSARAVLVGDFHPFRQSQKGFLRLVREVRSADQRPVGIALECFRQNHQHHLDHYSAGLITAEELRDEVSFERHWPFSWDQYREILEYARAERLPLLALNVPASELRFRDEAAADRLTEALAEDSRLRIFALYGELHLAEPHLPAALRARLPRSRVLVVHQNEPDLYWAAPRTRQGVRPEVLKLRADEFCVLNSVPWVKLRSYLDWAEGSQEDDWEAGTDVTGTVAHFAGLLAETLSLPAPAADQMEVLGPDTLPETSARDPDLAYIRHALHYQRVSRLPARAAILVPAVSTNALTEAAALFLRGNQGGPGPDELLLQFALGFLGSKLLNPKRKCNEEADLRAYLKGLAPARRARDAKARAFVRALALLAPILHARRPASAPLRGPEELEALRAAGYIVGNRLFLAFTRRKTARFLVEELFTEAFTRRTLPRVAKELRAAAVAPDRKGESF